jgi:hypothetical protein
MKRIERLIDNVQRIATQHIDIVSPNMERELKDYIAARGLKGSYILQHLEDLTIDEVKQLEATTIKNEEKLDRSIDELRTFMTSNNWDKFLKL